MSHTDAIGQPGISPAGNSQGESWGEWFDRHSRTFFIAPAVTLILIFAIFPTFYSIVFALSRVRFTGDGLQFRFVWFQNFAKQFFGNDQVHFLGKIGTMSVFGTVFFVAVTAAVLWWLYRSLKITSWVGMLGRLISAAMAIFIAWVMAATLLSGNSIGTLLTTLFYVIVGCALQFVIGTGLAFLCSQPISGKELFPRDLLHSADDHAPGRGLRHEDGCRHHQRPVPAALWRRYGRTHGFGQPIRGHPASS